MKRKPKQKRSWGDLLEKIRQTNVNLTNASMIASYAPKVADDSAFFELLDATEKASQELYDYCKERMR